MTLPQDPSRYVPRQHSLAARMIRFFKVNPEEELSPRDASIKFHCEYASVDQSLRGAIEAGLLVKVKRPDHTVVYRLPDLLSQETTA